MPSWRIGNIVLCKTLLRRIGLKHPEYEIEIVKDIILSSIYGKLNLELERSNFNGFFYKLLKYLKNIHIHNKNMRNRIIKIIYKNIVGILTYND